MNVYKNEFKFRVALLISALLIVSATLWYTHLLANKLAGEERKRMLLLADAYERLNQANENTDISFLLDIIEKNNTVPLVLTDNKFEVNAAKNFDSLEIKDKVFLKKQMTEMAANGDSISIRYEGKILNYIFYKDSKLLLELKYFPYVLLIIIIIFLAVAYLAFFSSQRSVQNQVWVGMAKETAHQLATPISSLSAWMEHLEYKSENDELLKSIVPEMHNDIQRLETITQRFSKIGSTPELLPSLIVPHINLTVAYMKRRASGKIQFEVINELGEDAQVKMNAPLLDWVMENLLRNALDAMDGTGKITVHLHQSAKVVMIDVKDSGKGIPADKFNTVFKPGYSTKKRGWGLGLSLCKRIVEEYHKGKIMVFDSSAKGTTFRIMLNK